MPLWTQLTLANVNISYNVISINHRKLTIEWYQNRQYNILKLILLRKQSLVNMFHKITYRWNAGQIRTALSRFVQMEYGRQKLIWQQFGRDEVPIMQFEV